MLATHRRVASFLSRPVQTSVRVTGVDAFALAHAADLPLKGQRAAGETHGDRSPFVAVRAQGGDLVAQLLALRAL